jgi:peptide/nickel transport system substrate-binding protein
MQVKMLPGGPLVREQVRAGRRSRAAATGLALIAAIVVATGCGSASSTGAGGPKITQLKIAVDSVNTLDPAKATYTLYWGAMYSTPAYAALFHVSKDGKIEPQLAQTWKYDNAGKSTKDKNTVFEFTLRPGVKFSDGSPLTAEAAVGWFKYFVKAKGLYSGDLGPDPKFTATGPLSVRIDMSVPNPSLPLILSDNGNNFGFIASPKAVANPKLLESGTYGAGPYMLQPSGTVTNDHYTFVPNPYYYDKPAVNFKSIYLKVIANPSTRLQAQQSGEYNVTLGSATTLAAAKKAGLEVLSGPQGMLFLGLDLVHDTGAPALKDVRVRQAMNYAINRPAMTKALFGTAASPQYGFITQDYDISSYNFKYNYDPPKAKQLLAQAGYAKGLTLKAICPAYFGNFGTPMMNAVAQDLEAVGIKLDLKCFPNNAAYSAYVFQFKAAVVHTLNILGNTGTTYPLYLSPKSPLAYFGGDKEIDRLYLEGATAPDPTEAWGKMWQRFTQQAYTVPLVTFPGIYYVSKGIGGVAVSGAHSTALPTEWVPTGK